MTAIAVTALEAVMEALATVRDPELDEPITDLGFVRSVTLDDDGVEVHLRLPTSFCSPNFAYLMASDSLDALGRTHGQGRVRVFLDDHHDSDKINAGLAAGAGYRGTFGVEALDSLDELRLTFLRKAHTAAMERCVARLLQTSEWTLEEITHLMLLDLPSSGEKEALLRRRLEIGLGIGPHDRVLVDDDGTPIPEDEIPLRLRFARTVRISIDGNGHFCRGLLRTRYGDDDPDLSTVYRDLRSVR